MTTGTKIFRIIISVLLALTMLWSVFVGLGLYAFGTRLIHTDEYGIWVAGISVERTNKGDILGDGTVSYDAGNNVLTFNNATIEYEDTVVYSAIDLHIQLIGENKIICTDEEYGIGIYAGDSRLNKDLAILGDGSLTIEFPNAGGEAAGISAANLTIESNLTVTTPDCEKAVNGIVCASSLMVVNKATVTVNNGAATKFSSAVRVRGNAFFEEGTTLKTSTNPGTTGICKGLTVNGDLFLGKNTTIDVSIDDSTTDQGECIRVSGLMEIGSDATVTASAKNASAIECLGTIEANKGATISAKSDNNDADIFCSGAVVNYGAEINAEIDAIGGVNNRE